MSASKKIDVEIAIGEMNFVRMDERSIYGIISNSPELYRNVSLLFFSSSDRIYYKNKLVKKRFISPLYSHYETFHVLL